MTTIGDVLNDVQIAGLVSRLSPPGDGTGRRVTGVTVVEDIAAIARAEAGAVVVVTARGSAGVSGYRLDLALRLAADRGVAVLVLLAGSELQIDPAANAIATEGLVTLLRADADISPAELVVAADRRLMSGAAAALDQAHRGLTRLAELRVAGAPIDTVLSATGTCLGRPVAYRRPLPDELAAPVLVEGRLEGMISTARGADLADEQATEMVLALCAVAVSEGLQRIRRTEEAPERRRAELVTELLSVDPRHAERLLDRARSLGFDIDGWHTAVLLQTDDPPADGSSESARFDRATEVRRAALEVARDAGGVWQRARSGAALLLVKIDPVDAGSQAVRAAASVGAELVERCAETGISARVGVGSPHTGITGLHQSAAEARAALAGGEAPVVSFDSLGTNRFLAEWSASAIGKEISRTLLAPLERLDTGRADTALRTLAAYLDHHGSLLHTAAALHLHRNSLAYRIKRILALLEVDLDDPDQWMMLQLACRARLLQGERTRP